MVLVATGVFPTVVTRLIADVGGLVGTAVAGTVFAVTGYRQREWWRWWLAIALFWWTVGQAMWSWHRTHGSALTFPWVENVFYFGLPLFTLVALIGIARHDPEMRRENVTSPRRVIAVDAAVIVCSLGVLLWDLALRSIVRGPTNLRVLLSLGYTFGDLVLVVLAILLVVTLYSARRTSLAWLMVGLITMGVSDAMYTYTTARGFEAPPVADLGYLIGPVFLLFAATVRDRPLSQFTPSLPVLALPYVPLAAVVATRLVAQMYGSPTSAFDMYLLGLVIGLVVLRQLLTLQQLYGMHEELRYRATHDNLTGVANRALVLEYLTDALERAQRRGYEIGLVYVDLDRFKDINDRFGHRIGDLLLRTCAERLRQCTRDTDLIGRIGGDEFVIILEPAGATEQLKHRLEQALDTPLHLGDEHVQGVAASVGHVLAGGLDTPAAALERADAAMYRDKAGGSMG